MLTEIVPRYLITKICAKNGQRLPKRVLYSPPARNVLPGHYAAMGSQNLIQLPSSAVENSGRRGRQFRRNDVIKCELAREKLTLECREFGFAGWEYRFWMVECTDVGPTLAVCRACSSAFFKADSRKLHIGANGCAKKIIAAYGLLLRDKLCVVCDAHTSNQKWGVPLCDKAECLDVYMHEEAQPAALERALILHLQQTGEV